MKKFFLLFVFVLLMIYPPFIAQESATEEALPPSPTLEPSFTPVPTETPLPSETATELPSVTPLPTETATETATLAFTETATATSTASPTQAEMTVEATMPTASETATASATNTATATSSATETGFASAYVPMAEFAYHTLHDLVAISAVSWSPLEREGQVWIAPNSGDLNSMVLGTGYNVGLELNLSLSSGAVLLELRNSSEGVYRLHLDASGNLSLWRSNVLLSTAIVTPFGTNSQKLRFYISEGQIRAELNELLVLAYEDSFPLPSGSIAFGLQSSQGFSIREIILLMETNEWQAYLDSVPATINVEISSMPSAERSFAASLDTENALNYANAVLFVDTSDILLVNPALCPENGCEPSIFIDVPGYANHAVWSPDRSQIAFVYAMPNNSGSKFLYIMDTPDGSVSSVPLTRVTSLQLSGSGPRWSPTENKIALSGRDYSVAGGRDIFLIDLDTCGSDYLTCHYSNLTNTADYDERGIDFSPDGSEIVFSGERPASYERDLAVMNVDGSNLRWISSNTVTEDMPDWSPDGTRIAFASGSLSRQIMIYSFASNEINPLFPLAQDDYAPSWSPDGSELVFTHVGATGTLLSGLMRMEAEAVQADGSLLVASSLAFNPDWGYALNYCPIPENQAMRSDTFSSFGTGDDPICGGTPEPSPTATASATATYTPSATPTEEQFPNPPNPTPTNGVTEVAQVPTVTSIPSLFCISRPIDGGEYEGQVVGLNIRSIPVFQEYNFVNMTEGRVRITGVYGPPNERWFRVDPYIDGSGQYTSTFGWVWEGVFLNPCETGSLNTLPIMDSSGSIIAIPTPAPSPTPLPVITPEAPLGTCVDVYTANPTNVRYQWYINSPVAISLEQYQQVDVYAWTDGDVVYSGLSKWYQVGVETYYGTIYGWVYSAFLDQNKMNSSVCNSVPYIYHELPPTSTPLPTNTPPPNLEVELPLPMTGFDPIAHPVRLTAYGCQFGGHTVLSRDVNPVGEAPGSYPVVLPVQAQIMVVDTDLRINETEIDNNSDLGYFVSVRVEVSDLPVSIRARLATLNARPGDTRFFNIPQLYSSPDHSSISGSLHIGFAHLQFVEPHIIPDEQTVWPAGTQIGFSGNTGGNYINHLDISIFWIEDRPKRIVPSYLQSFGDGTIYRAPFDLAFGFSHQAYYTMYDYAFDRSARGISDVGGTSLVNPLILWPSFQEGTGCPFHG